MDKGSPKGRCRIHPHVDSFEGKQTKKLKIAKVLSFFVLCFVISIPEHGKLPVHFHPLLVESFLQVPSRDRLLRMDDL